MCTSAGVWSFTSETQKRWIAAAAAAGLSVHWAANMKHLVSVYADACAILYPLAVSTFMRACVCHSCHFF